MIIYIRKQYNNPETLSKYGFESQQRSRDLVKTVEIGNDTYKLSANKYTNHLTIASNVFPISEETTQELIKDLLQDKIVEIRAI